MLRSGVILLSLSLFTLAGVAVAKGYDGFKLFEVIPKTQQQADVLYELSQRDELYDFFVLRRLPNNPAQVMVHRNEIKNFLSKLAHYDISFEILDEDVGSTVDKAFELNQLNRILKPVDIEGRLSTDRFYNHSEINSYIEYLAKSYPSRVIVKTVGKSFAGRDIKTITISNGDGRENKDVIFIDAGIHAREWIAPSTGLYVIEQLVENYEKNAEILKNHDIIVMPLVNPDGYEYSQLSKETRYWRKTRKPYEYGGKICYGCDANRNFDFHWNEGGASSKACDDTYAGPNAFSEPETIILRDLLDSLKKRGIFYLTLHSYGNYLMYPWGWTYDLPDNVADLDEIAVLGASSIFNATGIKYKTGSSTNTMYIASGGSDDYAQSIGFNISITMELSGDGKRKKGFAPDPSRIDSMVKEAWVGIRAMMKGVVEKYSIEHAEFL